MIRGKPERPYIPKPYRPKKRSRDGRVLGYRPIFKTNPVSIRQTLDAFHSQSGVADSVQHLNSGMLHIGDNSFSGSTNPFWKDQVRNVKDATTSASGVVYDVTNPWVSAQAAFRDHFNVLIKTEIAGYPSFGTPTFLSPSASDMSKTDDRAKVKFLERLDSVLSSVELGQDLGEYKETVHGITNPLGQMRKQVLSYLDSVAKLKRGYKKDAPGLLKALADSYLEWTFGWKPLSLDIADAIVGLQNRARHYNVVPIQAGCRNVVSATTSRSGPTPLDSFSLIDLSTNVRSQTTYTVRYKGVVLRKLQNSTIPVNEVLQLDLPHFIPTVWDLIPYSFIVDYFTNVGDVIRAYSARTQYIAWCCKTTRTEMKYEKYSSYTPSLASHPASTGQWEQVRTDGQTSRAIKTSFTRGSVDPQTALRPALHFEMPNSEKPWINIAAILASRISHLVPLIGR